MEPQFFFRPVEKLTTTCIHIDFICTVMNFGLDIQLANILINFGYSLVRCNNVLILVAQVLNFIPWVKIFERGLGSQIIFCYLIFTPNDKIAMT